MPGFKKRLASTQLRVAVFLTMGITIIAAYFIAVTVVDHNQEQSLFQYRLSDEQKLFNSVAKTGSTQLATFANDYTYWDDMVAFADGNGKDTQFAKENIDAAMPDYGADAAWVYNLKHQLIYSTEDLQSGGFSPKTNQPIKPDEINSLFAKKGLTQYYVNTKFGVFEISAATIVPTNDPQRKSPPHGFFFVGRLLSRGYLKGLSDIANADVSVSEAPSDIANAGVSHDIKSGLIGFGKKLDYFDGRTVAVYDVHYTAADLRNALKIQDKVIIIGVSVITAMTIGLLYVLIRWILQPINKLLRALSIQSDVPIANLIPKNNEFGSIARLIAKDFAQQKEMAAQRDKLESQSEELRKKVDEAERLNQTMVGRELRMIELKKEVEQLRQKSGDHHNG